MSSPIDVLWKGLKKLEDQHKDQKEKLLAMLKAKRMISKDDQDWLDGAANLVDEERVVEALESATDYDGAVHTLNARDQVVFDRLTKLASGGGGGGHGTKRKCEYFDACKEVDDTPMSSKVPNLIDLISEDQMARRIKQWAQGRNKMQPFISRWKSSTGTMQMGKTSHSQPNTSAMCIPTSNSSSPSYQPGSRTNRSGACSMSWRMMWLNQPKMYTQHSIQRSQKCWTPGSQWLVRMDSC